MAHILYLLQVTLHSLFGLLPRDCTRNIKWTALCGSVQAICVQGPKNYVSYLEIMATSQPIQTGAISSLTFSDINIFRGL